MALYEYEMRRQIVEALHQAQPDLDMRVLLFAQARSLRSPDLKAIFFGAFPESRLLPWHRAISLEAPAFFVAFALFLTLAIRH